MSAAPETVFHRQFISLIEDEHHPFLHRLRLHCSCQWGETLSQDVSLDVLNVLCDMHLARVLRDGSDPVV